MILHVTFTDGSNPWVSLPTDRETVKKLWRQWEKNHPATARPCAMCNGWQCRPLAGGGYSVARYFDGAHTCRDYERLGNALRALERLGGDTK